jgi:hypothetical protein
VRRKAKLNGGGSFPHAALLANDCNRFHLTPFPNQVQILMPAH